MYRLRIGLLKYLLFYQIILTITEVHNSKQKISIKIKNLTSSWSTKSARLPPLDHILSTMLSTLLLILHFVLPSVFNAYKVGLRLYVKYVNQTSIFFLVNCKIKYH